MNVIEQQEDNIVQPGAGEAEGMRGGRGGLPGPTPTESSAAAAEGWNLFQVMIS